MLTRKITSFFAALFLSWTAAIMLFVLMGSGRVSAQDPDQDQPRHLAAAVTWLVENHQNEDGGYSAFSTGAGVAPSDVPGTVDALIALGASGYNPNAPYPDRGATPITFLLDNAELAAGYAEQDGGAAGKLTLALIASGQNPRDFGGHNFAISLTNHLSPTGQFGVSNAFNQSLALLALSALNEPVPESSAAWLLAQQAQEGDFAGSWDDGFGTLGNTDATAMALMALLASGADRDAQAITAAQAFLASAQLPDGGWGYGPGLGASANSTALAVQALSALGENFYGPDSAYAVAGSSPLSQLLAWQSETGAFQADFGSGRFDDFFTTVQAIPALTGKAYPFAGRYEAVRQAVSCLAALQDPETGGWESFAGGGVDAGGTARAIAALSAAGEDPTDASWSVAGGSAVSALTDLTPVYLTAGRGGRVGIILQGVAAIGADPTDFAGANLVISATNYLSPTGEYDDTAFGPFSHNEAILGLAAANEAPDPSAIQWLQDAMPAGGWADADSNGSSLQVLATSGAPVEVLLSALRESQLPDGGWGFSDVSSPSSTSEAVQGLVLAGENPFSPTWSTVLSGTVRSPADTVLAQQSADGCWPNLFGPGGDPFGTSDAILLLAQDPAWGNPVDEPQAEADIAPTEMPAAVVITEEEPPAAAETPAPTESAPEAQTTAESTATTVSAEVASSTAEVASGSDNDLDVTDAATSETSSPEVSESETVVPNSAESDTPQAVNPVLAWILIGMALIAVLAVWFWSRRSES